MRCVEDRINQRVFFYTRSQRSHECLLRFFDCFLLLLYHLTCSPSASRAFPFPFSVLIFHVISYLHNPLCVLSPLQVTRPLLLVHESLNKFERSLRTAMPLGLCTQSQLSAPFVEFCLVIGTRRCRPRVSC